MAEFIPSHVLNDRDRPRVLLHADSESADRYFSWLEERSGTYTRVHTLTDVDLSEWDVLVTDRAYTIVATDDFGRVIINRWGRVPDHLVIFRVFKDFSYDQGEAFFDFNVRVDEYGVKNAETENALTLEVQVPGHSVRRIDGLPEAIQDLVKSDLVPCVNARHKQFGIRANGKLAPGILNFRPFMAGPGGLSMAASYERRGRTIWLLPADSAQLDAWFDAALVEWHLKDPQEFPAVKTWQTNPAWDTRDEREARSSLERLDRDFAAARDEYESTRATALERLAKAQQAATPGPKSLLSAQDDELQEAARAALEGLGFQVQNMDDEWDARERREDFRIRDSDEGDWLAIADVTGVAKGAPGSKIMTVQGYVTKFVIEERPTVAPDIWVIVNRLFHRDPAARGDLYRADERRTLEANRGLALDTAALYVLSEEIAAGDPRAGKCREWLRGARGQVTVTDALAWLDANPAPRAPARPQI